MSALIVIPARYGSSRLRGKPLLPIAGVSLIQRVYKIAKAVGGGPQIIIATDSEQIASHCRDFGAEVQITSESCTNGSERVYEVLAGLKSEPELVINLQGDSALMPPWVIEDLITYMQRHAHSQLATVAVKLGTAELERIKSGQERSGTFVTFDQMHRALYFSRALIPNVRDSDQGDAPIYKHLGIYGFRPQTLAKYVKLAPTPLEQCEKLEQLRALENGMRIDVVESSMRGRTPCSVDTKEDLLRAEEIIKREGELA